MELEETVHFNEDGSKAEELDAKRFLNGEVPTPSTQLGFDFLSCYRVDDTPPTSVLLSLSVAVLARSHASWFLIATHTAHVRV